MKPLEFLAEVLPSPQHGLYCIAELSSKRKEHLFVDELTEIKPQVKKWISESRDIYFALATFTPEVRSLTKNRRTATNATYVKAFFIDMDGYESKKAAAQALSTFLESTGLDAFGQPHVVGSGGGLHCYWPLDEAVDVVTWKPVAENFKRLCKQEGLRIDMTVTADAARVLRIPGTFNNKAKYGTPRPVQLLLQGTGAIDFKRFAATIRGLLKDEYAPPSNNFLATSVNIEGTRPSKAETKKSAMAEALMNNSATRFETIWLKTEKDVGCGQLAYYQQNAQHDGMEPLWRGLLSWTKTCEDGEAFSRKLSELHPYPLDRMYKKLDEIKGPYPCVKMDSENPGICPSCQYWGQITNALALGREVRVDNRTKTYELPLQNTQLTADELEEEAAAAKLDDGINDGKSALDDEVINGRVVPTRAATRPPPPKGFDYGENGGIYVTLKERDATGVEVKTQVPVLPYDLFVVDMLRIDEKEHYAHLMAVKKIGVAGEATTMEYVPIILPSKSVVAKEELLKCLASHNIYASHGATMDPYLFQYVRACVNQAALTKPAVDVPIQLGWQKNGTFVYNNRIFSKDGTEVVVPMPGLENINRNTNSKGTLEDWRKPWELLAQRQMYTLLAFCVDSFGSTLMHFGDYEGFVWHIGSTKSGTGKSLTLSLKAGVWGHPVRYRTSKGSSPVAMQQRAGLLNSLPLLIDEITVKSRTDENWVPQLIFDLTEGQGKERMESGSNKERINNSTWSLSCTLTSNTHLVDVLTGGRKHSTHGEMQRMLEWTPEEGLSFSEQERETLRLLRTNYGVAGQEWARWQVKNRPTITEVLQKVQIQLRKEFNFIDEERYWHNGCTKAVAAAIMLGPRYANIIELPVNGIISALKQLVESARAAYKRSIRSAEDVLNAYTRDHYGKFIVLRKEDSSILANFGADNTEGKTSTRNTVMGRIEHEINREGYVDYFIEETLLKAHCSSMSFGYSDFKRQLAALRSEGVYVEVVRKNMLARTDGPTMRVQALHIAIPKERVDDEVAQVSVGSD